MAGAGVPPNKGPGASFGGSVDKSPVFERAFVHNAEEDFDLIDPRGVTRISARRALTAVRSRLLGGEC